MNALKYVCTCTEVLVQLTFLWYPGDRRTSCMVDRRGTVCKSGMTILGGYCYNMLVVYKLGYWKTYSSCYSSRYISSQKSYNNYMKAKTHSLVSWGSFGWSPWWPGTALAVEGAERDPVCSLPWATGSLGGPWMIHGWHLEEWMYFT